MEYVTNVARYRSRKRVKLEVAKSFFQLLDHAEQSEKEE